MKQKITRVNWFLLLFTFVIEIICLNIVLNYQMSISIHNDIYKWVKAITVCISLDLIFILYILDTAKNKEKTRKILNIYKIDANLKISRSFLMFEVIKTALIMLAIGEKVKYVQRYESGIAIGVISIVFFYALYYIMPKRDNLARKLRKLKKGIKKGYTDLNFILIEGNKVSSSFDIKEIPECKISKNNLYINIEKDLPRIIKESKNEQKTKQFIEENTIAVIHELPSIEKDVILKKYNEQNLDNIHTYHIMAVEEVEGTSSLKEIEYINAIKICEISSAIEYTENLFSIRQDEIVSKTKYKIAKTILKLVRKYKKKEEVSSMEMKKLDTIYQYNFNNRLKRAPNILPKEKFALELYRNAYLNPSPYQSILIMFNYITIIGKLAEYYLFAKNNPNFKKNEIYNDIVGENVDIWNNHIIVNTYKNEESTLYKNVRETKFEISEDDKVLLKTYLSEILNEKIEGETITFDGAYNLLQNFRNKIEAHGIINDANVYAVWNLSAFFANLYSKILKVPEIECEYENDKKTVKVRL